MSDFGTSKLIDALSTLGEVSRGKHTLGVGTLRYMAPEVNPEGHGPLQGIEVIGRAKWSEYDNRCDVYSFGLLLWEMAHGQIAFGDMVGMQAFLEARMGGRPKIELPDEQGALSELIVACWHHDPSRRISMPVCVEQADVMLRNAGGYSSENPSDDIASIDYALSSTPMAGGSTNDQDRGQWTAKVGDASYVGPAPDNS